MSRAFTKEDDAGDDLPERPIPPGPNYVTPRGLELLQNAAEELVARRQKTSDAHGDLKSIDRDLRYLEARISSAIVVPPGKGDEIRFGAFVTLKDAEGKEKSFQIVGDDEARSDSANLISWSAPLALQMLGKKAGDSLSWQGPDGTLQYTVTAVRYS